MARIAPRTDAADALDAHAHHDGARRVAQGQGVLRQAEVLVRELVHELRVGTVLDLRVTVDHQVPLEAAPERQMSLALRWLVSFADARKGQPMTDALASEIMDAYQGQGSAIRKRDEVHKMAQANKAFAHFRW